MHVRTKAIALDARLTSACYSDWESEQIAARLAGLSEQTVERVLNGIGQQKGSLRRDPIEDDATHAATLREVHEAIAARFGTEPVLGSCHSIWAFQREYLAQRGIEWLSPSDLNPCVLFD